MLTQQLDLIHDVILSIISTRVGIIPSGGQGFELVEFFKQCPEQETGKIMVSS